MLPFSPLPFCNSSICILSHVLKWVFCCWFCLKTSTFGFECRYGHGFEIPAIQNQPKLKCSRNHSSNYIQDWDEKVFIPKNICPWGSCRKFLVLETHIATSVFILTKAAISLIPSDPYFQSLPLFIAVSDVFRISMDTLKKKKKVGLWVTISPLSLFLSAGSPNHLAWNWKLFILFDYYADFFTGLYSLPIIKKTQKNQKESRGLISGCMKSSEGKPGIQTAHKSTGVSEVCHSYSPNSVFLSLPELLWSEDSGTVPAGHLRAVCVQCRWVCSWVALPCFQSCCSGWGHSDVVASWKLCLSVPSLKAVLWSTHGWAAGSTGVSRMQAVREGTAVYSCGCPKGNQRARWCEWWLSWFRNSLAGDLTVLNN